MIIDWNLALTITVAILAAKVISHLYTFMMARLSTIRLNKRYG